MKKNKKFNGLALVVIMITFLSILTSCTTDFWDGFTDGYNDARGRSFDSGNILDRKVLPKP